MKSAVSLRFAGNSLAAIVTLLCWFSACPTLTSAQGIPGQNAVCSSSTGCSTQAGSSSFTDAGVLQGANDDFCSAIYNILVLSTSGEVIDARGISVRMTCASGTSPWLESSHGYVNKPSTILLPAGTISISYPWILPKGTKLIGEGTTDPADNNGGTASLTTIQASSVFPTPGPMIQFGDSNCPQSVCTGISIEHLTLDGNNAPIFGIVNNYSQTNTYVNHVTLYRVTKNLSRYSQSRMWK